MARDITTDERHRLQVIANRFYQNIIDGKYPEISEIIERMKK